MRDTKQRLAPLFYETGFLTDEEAEQVLPVGQRTVYDILRSDLSLGTIKELFTVDLLAPFQRTQPRDLEGDLYRPLTATSEEIGILLAEGERGVRPLLDDLVEAGLVSEDRRKDFEEMADSVSRPEVELALESGFIASDAVVSLVLRGKHKLARLGHQFMAVDLMVYNRIIDRKAAEDAMDAYSKDGTPVAEALRKKKAYDPKALVSALNKGLYFLTVSLEQTSVAESLLSRFPESLLRRETFVPFRRRGETVSFAIPDPLNFALCDLVTILTGWWVSPYFAPQEEVLRELSELFASRSLRSPGFLRPSAEGPSRPKSARPGRPSGRAGAARNSSRNRSAETKGRSRDREEAEAAAPAPRPATLAGTRPAEIREPSGPIDSVSAVRLVSSMVETAVEARATDIHIEPRREDTLVRLRIDGVLHNAMHFPRSLTLACVSRIKVLSNMNVTERRRPQDGHFSQVINDDSYDFRVSTLPTFLGEKVVIRILDASSLQKGIEDLGFWPEQKERIESLIEYPHGLVLAVGPTGAGKTSTLYAILRKLNREHVNIVTLEDPIEYELAGINQIEAEENLNLGFASGLRAILRQDPDIIMVGEIRDDETARVGVRAAITGHLVLSTLHSNTAVEASTTLRHMGVPSYLLGASMLGVISQRLVRKVCRHCEEDKKADPVRLQAVGLDPEEVKNIREGRGCKQCFQSGFLGRQGIYEILKVDDSVRQGVLADASRDELQKRAVNGGMLTLQESARRAVREGVTTPEEILHILLPGH